MCYLSTIHFLPVLITTIINSQRIVVRECELGGGSAVDTARGKNRYLPQFPEAQPVK